MILFEHASNHSLCDDMRYLRELDQIFDASGLDDASAHEMWEEWEFAAGCLSMTFERIFGKSTHTEMSNGDIITYTEDGDIKEIIKAKDVTQALKDSLWTA